MPKDGLGGMALDDDDLMENDNDNILDEFREQLEKEEQSNKNE